MSNYYQPEIETASPEQMRAWQDERLVKQVQHVWDNIPFYRKKMEEKGLYGYVGKVNMDMGAPDFLCETTGSGRGTRPLRV